MTERLVAVTSLGAVAGAVLCACRKEAKMSQKELADALKVNVSTWSRIENGDSALTIEQFFAAASSLSLAPSALMEQVESKLQSIEKRPGVKVVANRVEERNLLAAGALPIAATALLKAPVLAHTVTGLIALATKNMK